MKVEGRKRQVPSATARERERGFLFHFKKVGPTEEAASNED